MKCQEHYGVMSTGLTIKKIKTEIQNTLSGQHNLFGVYGFGSFFRSTKYNDIDLLLVSRKTSPSPLEDYYATKKELDLLSERIGIQIDITFLTYVEYLRKPLREMDKLVVIIEYET
jgi:predicted nucleotidyltransferase